MDQHQATSEKIIYLMQQHIRTHIEQPDIVFGEMPICPFSAKAHQENKVHYIVYDFQFYESFSLESSLFNLIREFLESESYEVLIVIHSNKHAFLLGEMTEFMQYLNKAINPFGLIAFSGHPLDDFNIKGVFTRRDPYINLVIQDRKTIEVASKKLKSTTYYDNWTVDDLNSIEFLSRKI